MNDPTPRTTPTPQPNEPTAEAHSIERITEALRRFENVFWNRPGKRPVASIPARTDDDDIMLAHAINELARLRAENEKLRVERDDALGLWTEMRVVLAKSRDANCCMSYGSFQVDAVEAANAMLNRMPNDYRSELTQLRASLSTAVDALERCDECLNEDIISAAIIKTEARGKSYAIDRDCGFITKRCEEKKLIVHAALAQLRPLLAGKPPTDLILSETPEQREQRRVASMVWLDSLGNKQPPAKRHFCRDCADNDGTCPWTGEPCDTKQQPVAEVKAEWDDVKELARVCVADVLEHEEAAWEIVEKRIRAFLSTSAQAGKGDT